MSAARFWNEEHVQWPIRYRAAGSKLRADRLFVTKFQTSFSGNAEYSLSKFGYIFSVGESILKVRFCQK